MGQIIPLATGIQYNKHQTSGHQRSSHGLCWCIRWAMRHRGERLFQPIVLPELEDCAEEADPPLEGISKEAMRLLLEYDWPGNVRELENVIERAVILGHGPQILPADLPAHLHPHGMPARHHTRQVSTSWPTLEELERDYIATILGETHWRRIQAAHILGIDRRTLYRKIHTYGLQPTTPNGGEV